MAQNDEKKDKGIEIDFDAFERQIDLEIDKLFIASESNPGGADLSGEIDGKKEEEVQGTIEMEPPVLNDSDILFSEEPSSAESSLESQTEISLAPDEIEFIIPEDEPIASSARIELQQPAEQDKGAAEVQIPFAEFSEQTDAQIEFSIPASAEEVFAEPHAESFEPDDIPELSFPQTEAGQPEASVQEFEPVHQMVEQPLELKIEQAPKFSLQTESFEQMLSQADQLDEFDELDRFIEALDVAYLSLDWDFSSENVAVLESAISDLKPYWERIHEAGSIQKVIRAVLQHLKARPNSLSPPLVDFISESLEFLKSLILSETGPGPAERSQLKSLLDRLHAIKGAKAQSAAPITEKIAAVEPSSTAAQSAAALAGPQLRDFCQWMALFQNRCDQAIQNLVEETKRLAQLEQVLGKKPALAPVTARLSKARSSVEEYIAAFRGEESEWSSRMESLSRLERAMADIISSSQLSDAATPASSKPSTSPAARPVQEEALPQASFAQSTAKAIETRQDRICLFEAEGKRFALPASSVVKIEKLPDRKARKLIGRGYATLDDFKPLFKSIKTGLLGEFSNLSPKDLKGYQFKALPLETIQSAQQTLAGSVLPELPSLVGGVILISNKKQHAMIFTDTSGAEFKSETIELRSEGDSTLGIIQGGSHSSVRVLNIDLILDKLDH